MSPLAALLLAKARMARSGLAAVRRESALKVGFVSISAVALWLGLFAGARAAFRLLERLGLGTFTGGALEASDVLMARLLSLLALVLFAMLIFSNALIAYSTLYRAREVPFLLASPISTEELFLGRFTECVVFSSWATAYLGAPLLLAYGLEGDAPWPYYLALVAFYLPFVVLPAALGSIAAMLLVLLAPRLGRLLGFAAVAALVGLFLVFRAGLLAPGTTKAGALGAVLELLVPARSAFLPSTWLAEGLIHAATGAARDSLFYWLLLLANALFFLWLATRVAVASFPAGWSALAGMGGRRRRGRHEKRHGILGRLEARLAFLPEPYRALAAKDLRLFWRDPAQWSQFLIFFGVMLLYLANRRGGEGLFEQELWRAWGALLNSLACLLILATLTTRFVFPLISLEGRRFWILGLAPISMRRIVWQKVGLSVLTTSVFTLAVALLSAWKLQLSGAELWISLAAIALGTPALSGLAVGLGSLYPDFEEDNPARIVSGLGGTLCFLMSVLYILAATGAQALVFHRSRLATYLEGVSEGELLAAAAACLFALSALACLAPLSLGIRNLERQG